MKFALGLTTLLLAAAVGCTDRKAATAANFEAAIDDYIAYNRYCAVYDAAFEMLPSSPMPDNAGYDSLLKSGGISKSPAPSTGGQPLFVYDLTTNGKATKTTVRFQDKLVDGYLCGGKPVVDKIIRFTEPAEDNGARKSRVTFTTKLVDVPDWVKTTYGPTPAKPDPNTKLSATMLLNSDGWKVDGTISEIQGDQ